MPHTDAAIKEAKFALDELGADGFGLSTHYAGVYLGDSGYDPLMELLNDTTRTFTNMVMHNIFGRYPNIKWIFPHAGAVL